MSKEEKCAELILDTMALLWRHAELLDQETGPVLLDEAAAMQDLLLERRNVEGALDRLARCVYHVQVLAEAQGHPGADVLRRRGRELLQVRDWQANAMARRGR